MLLASDDIAAAILDAERAAVELERDEISRLKQLRHRDALTIAATQGDSATAEAVLRAARQEAHNAALELAVKELECERAAGDSWEAKRINEEVARRIAVIRALKRPPG